MIPYISATRKRPHIALQEIKEEMKQYTDTLEKLEKEWQNAQNKTLNKQIKILNKQIKECATMLTNKSALNKQNEGFVEQELTKSEQNVKQIKELTEKYRRQVELSKNCDERLKNLQEDYTKQLNKHTDSTRQLNELKGKIEQYKILYEQLYEETTPRQRERITKCRADITNKLQELAQNQANMKLKYLQLQERNQELRAKLEQYLYGKS